MSYNDDDKIDSLERTLQEIDALAIIYNDNDDDDGGGGNSSSHFSILSTSDFHQAQEVINKIHQHDNNDDVRALPLPSHLNVQLSLSIAVDEDDNNKNLQKESIDTVIQFTLPLGYPTTSPATVSIVSVDTLNRRQRDDLSSQLNQNALNLVGSEALMELIQDFREGVASAARTTVVRNRDDDDNNDDDCIIDEPAQGRQQQRRRDILIGRRWIWVHHITKTSRIKDIVQRAKELSLGGYLKSGYPGVVVVEGSTNGCDEFVVWIKGNKSRPDGGFGRNWGHHVRGQIDGLTADGATLGGGEFVHVGEDLGDLARFCRECGLEDEFLAYVMQH